MTVMARQPAPEPNPRRIALVLDGPTVDLASAALRGEADRHRRVAVKLSGELEDRRIGEGADIRTGALQVVRTLADADALIRAADLLELGYARGLNAEDLGDVDDVEDDLDLVDVVDGDPDIPAARAALGLVPTIPEPDPDAPLTDPAEEDAAGIPPLLQPGEQV